jgi:beta-xylosidase
MMSRRLQITHITGCYEYRSPIRRRVNVELYEKRENEESMTRTTTTTSASHVTAMGNGNKKFTSHSSSAADLPNRSVRFANNKDVAKWSSVDVQHWIKKQCRKYELKRATAENFEMNGRKNIIKII